MDSSKPLNSPMGKIRASLWYVANWGTIDGDTSLFDGEYGIVLLIGGMTANHHPVAPILTPKEAAQIDIKLDDGKPATGKVVIGSGFTDCTDATHSFTLDADYLLANPYLACTLVFRRAF